MKDLHAHILYGIDDGPKTIDESLEIIKKANKYGITDIVLTPHYIKNTKYNADNKKKQKLLKELRNKVKENNIDINLYLGNEVFIDDNFISLYKEIFTINNSRYILIEFPLTIKLYFLERTLEIIKSNNLIPIIAHPERYLIYYNDYNFFENLIKKGCLLQGNIGSLYGYYGLKSKLMLKKLLKKNMIHFIASDIHNKKSNLYRKNISKDLLKIVKSKKNVEDLLENNIDKVLKNEEIRSISYE